MKIFRAWYKYDEPTFVFELQLYEDNLIFVAKDNEKLTYSFETPFIDDDWIVEERVAFANNHTTDIFMGDVIQWKGYEVKAGKQIRPIKTLEITGYRTVVNLLNLIGQGYEIKVIGNTHNKKK